MYLCKSYLFIIDFQVLIFYYSQFQLTAVLEDIEVFSENLLEYSQKVLMYCYY